MRRAFSASRKAPKNSAGLARSLSSVAPVSPASKTRPKEPAEPAQPRVKSPPKKNGTSPAAARTQAASEESDEYEYVYSEDLSDIVPADAPDNMLAGFPGINRVAVGVAVTPQGKQLKSPRAPGTDDSTYVAPSWTPGAAALRPTHREGVMSLPAKAEAAGGEESPYEYYTDDDGETRTRSPRRDVFPSPPTHGALRHTVGSPSTARRSQAKAHTATRDKHRAGLAGDPARSSSSVATLHPWIAFWNQVPPHSPPFSSSVYRRLNSSVHP